MGEDEFRENIANQTRAIDIELSEKQIEKFYLYMRTFTRVE